MSSAVRIFDLSLGQMLWSRRSVFLGLLLGGPVLLAGAVRTIVFLYAHGFRINGATDIGVPSVQPLLDHLHHDHRRLIHWRQRR